MSDITASPEDQAESLLQQFKETKYEQARIHGQLIGSLELKLTIFQSLVETTQAELDQERSILRLLVREQTGQLTPEEQIQLEEIMKAAPELIA